MGFTSLKEAIDGVYGVYRAATPFAGSLKIFFQRFFFFSFFICDELHNFDEYKYLTFFLISHPFFFSCCFTLTGLGTVFLEMGLFVYSST